jgi:hypothetical protein
MEKAKRMNKHLECLSDASTDLVKYGLLQYDSNNDEAKRSIQSKDQTERFYK